MDDETPGWSCPSCCAPVAPRETPAGTFCRVCAVKIESCCEGAPAPEKRTS